MRSIGRRVTGVAAGPAEARPPAGVAGASRPRLRTGEER
jgi:hypothetical protein